MIYPTFCPKTIEDKHKPPGDLTRTSTYRKGWVDGEMNMKQKLEYFKLLYPMAKDAAHFLTALNDIPFVIFNPGDDQQYLQMNL